MREFWGLPHPVVSRGPPARQVPVTFLSSALTEFVTLAAPPGFVHAMGDASPEAPRFAFDDEALALRAIEAGLEDARASGTRAAVCLADLAPADGGAPAVGLAIYPVHGEDAVTLFERARASARRDRMQRAAAGDALVL